MRKLIVVIVVSFCSLHFTSAQKSKVIGAYQLIENGKYDEAKGIIEEAIKRKGTAKWARTWYTRGFLCQSAYAKGVKKNKKELTELYPNQLYIALVSYKKAQSYDKHGRYEKLLPPKYVLLANEFIKVGETHFNTNDYESAFGAFENALKLSQNWILDLAKDTNLMYNTALSAYKSGKWDKAIDYLSELNEYQYSSNVPHLLFSVYIKLADTASAHEVLLNGINNYKENKDLILLFAELLYKNNEPQKAVDYFRDAFKKDTANYIYPYAIGLLYQKSEAYDSAISVFKQALTLPSDTLRIYTGIGTCYFNKGVDLNEQARAISDNNRYREVKAQSLTAFESALHWFEKASEMDEENQELITKLNQLYIALDNKEKLSPSD